MAGTYVVEREQRVQATPAEVMERVTDFRRWRSWSPWEDLDPRLRRSYSGADAGVGAVYEWEGNRKAGKGRMEITSVEPEESATIALQFLKPSTPEAPCGSPPGRTATAPPCAGP